jgi:hypothetical protein
MVSKNGSNMRSGHFENGVQIGEWTTFEQTGALVNVTLKKPAVRQKR